MLTQHGIAMIDFPESIHRENQMKRKIYIRKKNAGN